MKNMISKFGMLAVLSSLSFSALAGTVTLKSEDKDGILGASFNLIAVAKINGTLEVDLINAGLADLTVLDSVEGGDPSMQRFAFGAIDIAGGAAAGDAEAYSIDPRLTGTPLKDHACGVGSSDAGSIQRLIEDEDRPGACTLGGATDKINAEWNVGYLVRASGGAHGILSVTKYDGVDDDGITPAAALAFLTSEVAAPLFADGDMMDINKGAGSLLDGAHDDINYKVSFDVRGQESKAVSRIRFEHVLQVQP